MTFHTTKPFYPYSEPANQRAAGNYDPNRLLRVFFLSDSRMAGALGPNAAGTMWPGQVKGAGKLDGLTTEESARALNIPRKDLPEGTWLTVFEDRSSPRPGVADLYFSADRDQSTLERPAEITTDYQDVPIYLDLMASLWVAGWAIAAWFARFKNPEHTWRSRIKYASMTLAAFEGCYLIFAVLPQFFPK